MRAAAADLTGAGGRDGRGPDPSAPSGLGHELADAVASGLARLTLHLLPDGRPQPGAELLRAAERAADGLTDGDLAGRPVGAVLTSSWDALALLVGAVLAGIGLCSLPAPARGTGPDDYRRFVERIGAEQGLAALLVDPDSSAARALAAASGRGRRAVPVRTFGDLGGTRAGRAAEHGGGGFELIQFTSGSTGDPKGVVLSQRRILANIEALVPSILDPGFVAVSWLPLSHDMGLVGLTLAPMVAAGRDYLGSGTLAVMAPRSFVRRPAAWLDACSELGATFTCAPDFAYRLVAPLVGPGLDLSRLRTAASGGEPVRPATLRAFEAAAGRHRLAPTAMSPCYGLAEATLAVTVTPPDRRWRSTTLDRAALDDGRVVEIGESPVPADPASTDDRLEIVAVGPPLPGFEIRVEPGGRSDRFGRIQVRGPSLLERYTDGSPAVDADGWFTTLDLGFVLGGDLHVSGRTDDALIVGGRLVFAHDLEAVVSGPGSGVGAAMVVRSTSGRPVLLFEPDDGNDGDGGDGGSAGDLAARRSALAARMVDARGVAPEAVWACPTGSLPRTPSGKPRRRQAERWLLDGTLPLVEP